MIEAFVLGALVGLGGAGILIWWVGKTFWDSYQTTRISRRITRDRRRRG